MSAFTAYFDASGTEHDQPCLAVAGYVALAEQWIEFEKQWLARLQVEGLDCFHSTEVRSRWKYDQPHLDRLYRDLIAIISDNVIRQFGCVMVNRSLKKWSREDRDKWNMTAYSMAGRTCAGQLRSWCRWNSVPILPEMLFECGDTGKGSLIKLLEGDGFPSPTFKPKKDTVKKGLLVKAAVPLQAADLLAYECFYPVREKERTGSFGNRWFAYDALANIRGWPKLIFPNNMEDLQKMATLPDDQLWIPEGPGDQFFTEWH